MAGNTGFGVPASLKSKGAYAAAKMDDIQGGLHYVKDEAAMIQIPPYLRQVGMEVFVDYTNKKYRLVNNPSTPTTVLRDWKYLPDAISTEMVNKLVTDDELNEILNRLKLDNQRTFISIESANTKFITADNVARYYQSKDGMRHYVSNRDLDTYKLSLSKIVTNILPPSTITVSKGTEYSRLYPPTIAKVFYADGTIEERGIIWNYELYDPELVGLQVIEGTVLLPDYVDTTTNTNVDKIRLFIRVARETDEIIEEVRFSDVSDYVELSPVTVPYGTELRAIELPSEVTAKLVDDNGEIVEQNLPVEWDYSQFTGTSLTAGVNIYGDFVIVDGDNITNILNIRPKVSIIVTSTNVTPVFQYKRGCMLPTGNSVMTNDTSNRLNNISAVMFYGVGNDPSQRTVDLRFTGIYDDNGINITPAIVERYPDGIRMPVLTSTDEDVNAFLDALREFDDILGYKLEYEVPGCPFSPRVLFDDETKSLNFGSMSIHNCGFLIRKSSAVNLPYPDIC